MTAILILSVLIDVCLVAVYIGLARRHNAIHKAMHLRVTSLMSDFAPDQNCCDNKGDSNKGNQYEVHGILSCDGPMRYERLN